ncbi:hypothetical protein FOXB_13669 [Fusarium oxysporum f. sp. conglutinans Fo5176]|uniref:Uncharacterized protein n=1 Tax=Fusarium oxysporum (strain Fo5176) TaxID=660025 RepID=F9G4T7_FUSOF|nr:hypothetical protein FOXB_13669 [Fusarium oxysporum f. sp. conglutinans Fo5176]
MTQDAGHKGFDSSALCVIVQAEINMNIGGSKDLGL